MSIGGSNFRSFLSVETELPTVDAQTNLTTKAQMSAPSGGR